MCMLAAGLIDITAFIDARRMPAYQWRVIETAVAYLSDSLFAFTPGALPPLACAC